MSSKSPKSLSELILRPGSALNDLARQAQAAVDLAGHLRASLPGPLAGGLSGAALREDGTLVVMASSPAWAARLRFEGSTLLIACREIHPRAGRIEIRVAGPPAAP